MKNSINLLCIGIVCVTYSIVLTSCDAAQSTPTYDCVWVDSCPAGFKNTTLYEPLYWCDPSCLEQFFPPEENPYYDNMYNLCESVIGGEIGDSFKLSWITSIYTKLCDSIYPSSISSTLQLDQNNYYIYLTSNDEIEPTQIVRNGNSINNDDYKNQLVFQIFNVEDPITGGVGTITWSPIWLGVVNTDRQYYQWDFYFDNLTCRGTFVPNRGYPRYIYVNNDFDYYYTNE